MKRGDLIQTSGGATGWYVGTTMAGTVWVAYRIEDLIPMAEAFDRRK